MTKVKGGSLFLAFLAVLFISGIGYGKIILKATPSEVEPGEKIYVRFSGTPGNQTDWIAIYAVGEKSENYGEWYYLEGKTEGELVFTAPQKEGEYEFRLFFNWPEGDYKTILTSNTVRVVKSKAKPGISYQAVFLLSTGEIIRGELLSFTNGYFEIKTEKGIIKKEKEQIKGILFGVKGVAKEKIISQWASDAKASSEYSSHRWSARQATGKPNTWDCGDIDTAWAPGTPGSDPEWLEVTFDVPVYATKLRVHETYASGFIYWIEFVDIGNKRHTVWRGKDNTKCPGWFELEIKRTPYQVKSVIIHTQIDGYEEIDAVELTGVVVEK